MLSLRVFAVTLLLCLTLTANSSIAGDSLIIESLPPPDPLGSEIQDPTVHLTNPVFITLITAISSNLIAHWIQDEYD